MTKDMSFLALDELIIFQILQKLQANSQGSLLPVPVKQERERPWLGLVTCVTPQNVTFTRNVTTLVQNVTTF